jgi:hypothetical protein
LAPAAGVRGGRPGGGTALASEEEEEEEEEESFQLNPALARHWPGGGATLVPTRMIDSG